MKVTKRLRELLAQRRGFLVYSLTIIGIPMALGLLVFVGPRGGPVLWIGLTTISFAGAYAWGVLAWKAFGKDGADRYRALKSRKDNELARKNETNVQT
jgi:alkanesulfonate monooxygenase SsuD/methylene tetrahydromethanopterin reductase-like flavin-dependent oxidoreductase (luciferase family)